MAVPTVWLAEAAAFSSGRRRVSGMAWLGRQETALFTDLIMRKDREGIMAQITKVRVSQCTPTPIDSCDSVMNCSACCAMWQPEVEKQNIRRVVLKTKTFAQNIDADVKADESSATYLYSHDGRFECAAQRSAAAHHWVRFADWQVQDRCRVCWACFRAIRHAAYQGGRGRVPTAAPRHSLRLQVGFGTGVEEGKGIKCRTTVRAAVAGAATPLEGSKQPPWN